MSAGDLKVNFSDQESSSEARSFEAIPTGKYHVKVTDGEWKECGPESKNPGKPYVSLELTVQEGPFEGRKLFANVMLFDGALYSYAQLAKATGHEEWIKRGLVPAGLLEEIDAKDMLVNVKKQRDAYAMERDGDDVVQYKNEVKGFMPYTASSTSASSGAKGGLLP